ncbi:MAG: hypothetical protein B7Y02_02000 [Rhodobacterales bacterium 17-64-5]|nr:MAG: hypothetical protein B7Z31_06530 [Rhodobacterales bacterium 12-65-15]OZA18006.1 MAG: hypothetical protein B7Y02_02000 [Rhodobacterales bacterium 17-64-5]
MALLLVPPPAFALTLTLPGSVINEEQRSEVPGSYALPTAPFDGTSVPARRVDGAIDQRAFELMAPGLTTLAAMMPLRDQVLAAGYEVILDCETRACGGFDFRYGIDVIPEPKMHVDIGDFRFLSAERDDEVVSILVSRSAASTFVQITRVTPAALPNLAVTEDVDLSVTKHDRPLSQDGARIAIGLALDADGSAALDDLVFASGSSALTEGEYPSLAAVAAWLEANPGATIALVGHTDASGSLTANIALSKRRAEAVAEALIATHGVDPTRIAAEGAGYLAPRATNQTDAGRQLNRRVEVIVTSIQ